MEAAGDEPTRTAPLISGTHVSLPARIPNRRSRCLRGASFAALPSPHFAALAHLGEVIVSAVAIVHGPRGSIEVRARAVRWPAEGEDQQQQRPGVLRRDARQLPERQHDGYRRRDLPAPCQEPITSGKKRIIAAIRQRSSARAPEEQRVAGPRRSSRTLRVLRFCRI